MSQSGYTPIALYSSGTASATPTSGNLFNGELALNYNDGKLYYKDSSGVVQIIASKAGNVNVSSINFGTTGLTPSTATTGAVTVAGTLITSNGGTGLSSWTAGDLPYYASGTALSKLGIGTAGQVLTVNSGATAPQWTTLSGVAVTTFQTSLSGLTPNTATSGAVTLAGTLGVASGGTGLTTLTAGYIPYGNGTSAFSSSGNLYFSGTRLGVNTSSPSYSLDVTGTLRNTGIARLGTGATTTLAYIGDDSTTSTRIIQFTRASAVTDIVNIQGINAGVGPSDIALQASGGNIGIGTSSPATKLNVSGSTASGAISTRISNTDATGMSTVEFSDGTNTKGQIWAGNGSYASFGGAGSLNYSANSGPHVWYNNYSEYMRLDSSGNLGLGVTPSAWNAGLKAIDVNGGALMASSTAAVLSSNCYYNGSWIYKTSSYATRYENNNGAAGVHAWYTAPSGTAGTAITFTQQMTLSNSGALSLPNADASIHGVTVGLGGGSVSTNTVVGLYVLGSNTSGSGNASFGYSSLQANTTGSQNTSIGALSLYTNSTGSNNIAIGYNALNSNTTGSANVGVGYNATKGNTTGTQNNSLGFRALETNSTGNYNNAFGSYAMFGATGSSNSAFGDSALYNSSGSYNTAIGLSALQSNTTASNNTAVGYQAGYSNTTGDSLTAVGWRANNSNTTGVANSSLGYSALQNNTTGSNNTAMGNYALINNTTASNNTAIGVQAGYSNTTGAYNVAIGNYTLQPNQTGNYNTAVGYCAVGGNGGTNNFSYNSGVGFESLFSTTTGSNNTALGTTSLYSNTTGTGNTAVGYQASYLQSGNSNYNTALGYQAGYNVTTGGVNTFVGYLSGNLMTTGNYNTILGSYNGNQGGLDIRTSSNYIVLSDGAGNPRQIIDGSGNWGLGVAPSAWGASAKVLELPNGTYLLNYATSSQAILGANAYYTGSNWIYKNSSASSNYEQNTGVHKWYTAPSGTAGTVITFTQAMTLDNSGRLLINSATPDATSGISGAKLQVLGGIVAGIDGLGTGGTGYIAFNSAMASAPTSAHPIIYHRQNVGLGLQSDYAISFAINGSTEAARIDNSGNLLVGATSAGYTSSNPYIQTNAILGNAANTFTVASLGTSYTLSKLPNAFSGIIIIRDNTAGGNIVYITDPNTGAISIASNLTGGITFTFSNTGPTSYLPTITQTAGATGHTFVYMAYGI